MSATAKTAATKRDRVYVEKTQIEVYRNIAGTEARRKNASVEEQPPFSSLKDAFLAAMCLGFMEKHRRPLRDRKELVLVSYFKDHPEMTVIQAIAVAETGTPEAIDDADRVFTIAEEYANGGFHVLADALSDGGPPLVSLVKLLTDCQNSAGEGSQGQR